MATTTGWLCLTRRKGQRVRLSVGEATYPVTVWVHLNWAEDGGAGLAFLAPPAVEIMREELLPGGGRTGRDTWRGLVLALRAGERARLLIGGPGVAWITRGRGRGQTRLHFDAPARWAIGREIGVPPGERLPREDGPRQDGGPTKAPIAEGRAHDAP